MTRIEEQTFQGCTSLTSVTIGNSVTSIGDHAFTGCTSLEAITVDADNSTFSSVDGVLFDKSLITLILCPEGKTGNYTIPNTVTTIADHAFDGCTSLTSVTIPSSVTSISVGAFLGCTSLTSVTIGNGVTTIGDNAFTGCTSLTSVTIPNSVTSIGVGAFWLCTSLTSITIPSSVTFIADWAFIGCTSLTGVYFKGNAPSVGGAFDSSPTIYYLPGTVGWETDFYGLTPVLWDPQIETSAASFGVRANRFGFNITATSDLVIVVEASISLPNPIWSPVSTNTLTGGTSYFSDPQWANYPTRFYRLRSP